MPRAYVELLRPANVATALADVLAGCAVAGLSAGSSIAWLMVSSACLYGGGVVLNDYFDRVLDASERPERPIPSGRVSAGAAARFGAALLAAGALAAGLVGAATGAAGAAIAACVLIYDRWGKHSAWFGPVNMGLCRGLNFLLGVAAEPAALADNWHLALFPFFYIWAVTALSRGEVHGARRQTALFSLIAVCSVLAGLLLMSLAAPRLSLWGVGLAFVLGFRVLPPFRAVLRDGSPRAVRSAVGRGVLSLVLLEAAIGGVHGGLLYGLVILSTLVGASLLARAYAVT